MSFLSNPKAQNQLIWKAQLHLPTYPGLMPHVYNCLIHNNRVKSRQSELSGLKSNWSNEDHLSMVYWVDPWLSQSYGATLSPQTWGLSWRHPCSNSQAFFRRLSWCPDWVKRWSPKIPNENLHTSMWGITLWWTVTFCELYIYIYKYNIFFLLHAHTYIYIYIYLHIVYIYIYIYIYIYMWWVLMHFDRCCSHHKLSKPHGSYGRSWVSESSWVCSGKSNRPDVSLVWQDGRTSTNYDKCAALR